MEVFKTYTIGKTFKGFAARISDDLLPLLQDDPLVAEIHVNGIAHTQQEECTRTDTKAASWGLARTSHLGNIDGGMNNHYTYTPNGGLGVNAYVLDTGVFVNHIDLRGRATWGYNAATGSLDEDRNGHGSHCAGTIAGEIHGIAKQAHIIAVKVLGDSGSGSYATIVDGIGWTLEDFLERKKTGQVGVVSMSLSGGIPGGMDVAIESAYKEGLPFIVAAGNSNANACSYYPAAFKDWVITVGATDAEDVRSYFSNYGDCVKLFAPGTGITSIWWDGTTEIMSGTSMACPHVAGQATVLLSRNFNLTPKQLQDELQAQSQLDLIINPGLNSPNLLLFNGCN